MTPFRLLTPLKPFAGPGLTTAHCAWCRLVSHYDSSAPHVYLAAILCCRYICRARACSLPASCPFCHIPPHYCRAYAHCLHCRLTCAVLSWIVLAFSPLLTAQRQTRFYRACYLLLLFIYLTDLSVACRAHTLSSAHQPHHRNTARINRTRIAV